jgi:hypothetical protein
MKQHLIDSQTTYFNHAIWAFKSGIYMIYAGITSLIHAIYPGFFPGTAAKTVIDLYYQRLHNHANPAYKSLIKLAKAKYQIENKNNTITPSKPDKSFISS